MAHRQEVEVVGKGPIFLVLEIALEEFHRLPMTRRMTVVACRDWSDFKRFMPHLSGAVGAATLDTGTVIYVTPKIAEKHFDLAEFLRHELSHAALRQNQSLYHAFTMRNQEWFNEGLAVSFGRQKSYLSDDEFLERAREQDLGPVIDPEQHAASGPLDMRFNYPAWRYFLEYMIEQRGRDRFQTYLAGFLDRPQANRDLFAKIYGTPFPDAIRGFQSAIRERRWKPGAR